MGRDTIPMPAKMVIKHHPNNNKKQKTQTNACEDGHQTPSQQQQKNKKHKQMPAKMVIKHHPKNDSSARMYTIHDV